MLLKRVLGVMQKKEAKHKRGNKRFARSDQMQETVIRLPSPSMMPAEREMQYKQIISSLEQQIVTLQQRIATLERQDKQRAIRSQMVLLSSLHRQMSLPPCSSPSSEHEETTPQAFPPPLSRTISAPTLNHTESSKAVSSPVLRNNTVSGGEKENIPNVPESKSDVKGRILQELPDLARRPSPRRTALFSDIRKGRKGKRQLRSVSERNLGPKIAHLAEDGPLSIGDHLTLALRKKFENIKPIDESVAQDAEESFANDFD